MRLDRFRYTTSEQDPKQFIIEDDGPEERPDDFLASTPIRDYVTYFVGVDSYGKSTVSFGLLATDGTKNYYQCEPFALATIAHELDDLARRGLHVQKVGTDVGFNSSSSAHDLKPDDSLPLYVGSILKIQRATKILQELELLTYQYARRVRAKAFLIKELNDYSQYKLSYSAAPPAEYPLALGDFLHNLRSALDLLINDVVRIRGKDTKDADFPFASTKEKFNEKLAKKKYQDQLGPELIAEIKAAKPYRDGNAELHSLHMLDIIDKHRLVIPISHDVWYQLDTKKLTKDIHEKAGNSNFCPLPDAGMVQIKTGDEFFCPEGYHPLQYISKIESPVALIFPSTAEDFSGKPILETCNSLVHLVLRIVLNISEKFPATS